MSCPRSVTGLRLTLLRFGSRYAATGLRYALVDAVAGDAGFDSASCAPAGKAAEVGGMEREDKPACAEAEKGRPRPMPWWCGRGPSYVDDERTAEGSYDRVAGGALIADELAVDDARNEAPDASVSSRSRPLVSSSGKPSAPEGMAMSITGELDGSNEMSPERLSLVWPRGDRCGVTLVRGEIDSAKICGDRLSVSTAGDRGETWASREKSSGAGRRLVDDPPLDFGLRDPASVCARSAGEDDDKVVLRREAPRGGVAVGVDGELSTNVRGEAFDVVGPPRTVAPALCANLGE